MKKLVIMMSVDLDEATFAKVCMQCGGVTKIPGIELFQLPEFASVNLAKILEKGVREEKPVPLPVVGSEPSVEQEAATEDQGSNQVEAGEGDLSLEEAAKDPAVKERAKGLLGSGLGLRGRRGP